MAYFLMDGLPTPVWSPNQNQVVFITDAWLIFIHPLDSTFRVIAERGPEDKVWTKSGKLFYINPNIIDGYHFLATSDEAQEISKEEAHLVLFEIR